jgi:hypothetical protein
VQKLFPLCCLFLYTNVFSQHATIKVVKDTSFQIADFISFEEKDTTETFSFIRQKYFSKSEILIGAIQKNCTDKADNPPYSLIGTHLRIDFCLSKGGGVYFPVLTILDKNYVTESVFAQQLKDLGFMIASPYKMKKITTTEFRMENKERGRFVTISAKKRKITGVSLTSWPIPANSRRKSAK